MLSSIERASLEREAKRFAARQGYVAQSMRLPPASEGLHFADGFRRALAVVAVNPKALTSWLAVLGMLAVAAVVVALAAVAAMVAAATADAAANTTIEATDISRRNEVIMGTGIVRTSRHSGRIGQRNCPPPAEARQHVVEFHLPANR